jgi:anaerobic magnesium-protoporphyrin IX monomethyl ester cyclase
MKDIILINGYRVGCPVLPTGIGYVAQAIENAGFDYNICDVNLQTHDQIAQLIRDTKPKYVGLGTMTYEVEKNYQLLNSIRNVAPNATIILGGPHAIAAGKQIFQECYAIDVVIQGEGEESLVKLLKKVPLNVIPGILTKDSQDVVITKEFLNIDNISFPKYNKFELAKYGNTMQIASSRGCVYQCSFCGAPKFLGNKWRAFKVERMIEEFEYWYRRGFKQFYFSDSLFALDKKRVIDFCRYIVDSGYNDTMFTADGLRADHLTFEILQHMKKANFKSLIIGVESVNDETLDFFKKGASFSQIDNAISIADSLGFYITIYLIIGAPKEAYNDVIKSIRYPMKYKNIVNAVFSKLVPIMGTPYYDYAIEHKLLFDKSAYYPKPEAYGFNEKQFSHNSVEEIWTALYPEFDEVSRFLSIRYQINKLLSYVGFHNIDVKRINILTQISLNPVMLVFGGILIHIVKLVKLKRIFKRLKSTAMVQNGVS